MSIVIYADASQSQDIAKQIAEAAFPSRLRLSLYTHGTSAQPDCVFKPMRSGLRCVARPFYPINRLRNIAIAASEPRTSSSSTWTCGLHVGIALATHA